MLPATFFCRGKKDGAETDAITCHNYLSHRPTPLTQPYTPVLRAAAPKTLCCRPHMDESDTTVERKCNVTACDALRCTRHCRHICAGARCAAAHVRVPDDRRDPSLVSTGMCQGKTHRGGARPALSYTLAGVAGTNQSASDVFLDTETGALTVSIAPECYTDTEVKLVCVV